MTDVRDLWIVQLDEMMGHVQRFVDDNPMNYRGREKRAYTTGLGMVSVLCRRMIEDMVEDKGDE